MALEIGNEYKDIASKIIDKYPLNFGHIEVEKVLFLKETEKSPKKYADIRAVRPPYTFMTENKFIITFYEPVMDSLTSAQKIMVVYHELLHIDLDFNKVKGHNVEDFQEIISVFGSTWTIDDNLPNILEDENNAPEDIDRSTPEDLAYDEPEIL